MGALWRTTKVDNSDTRALAESMKIPYKIAKWLRLRGVDGANEATLWLDANRPWTNPFAYLDLEAAIERIRRAVANRERIGVVGDYDVDGVTASAILASTLESLQADWVCMIPHRVEDGYGLSERIVERAANAGCHLLVTVDNGIRANEAVLAAVRLGIDVIVTDHHEPGECLPTGACAIVHWQRHAEPDDAKLLSGAGVSWKLSTALLATAGINDERLRALHQMHIALATLGALADIMPVRGENRRLIREGLSALKTATWPGWLALCEIARVDPLKLNESAVLWKITPRLNSAGRMGTAEVAFQLLMAEDLSTAQTYAVQIEEYNNARRSETTRVTAEAVEQWRAYAADTSPAAVVVAGEWNLGVVGIVANRLVDTFGCPAIVLADLGGNVLRGSGRAPNGFSLHTALEQCTDYLDHFGGHDAAVGCGVSREMIEPFRTALAEVAVSIRQADEGAADAYGGEVADDYLPVREATLDTVTWLERFAPFGPENAQLMFYVGPVELVQVNPMQGGKHVRLAIKEGADSVDLVWFQAPSDVLMWSRGQMIGAIVSLEANTWQGVRRAQLIVNQAWQLRGPLLSRDAFGAVYRELRRASILERDRLEKLAERMEIDDLDVILGTFVELGFAERIDSAYHVNQEVEWRDLRDAITYQTYLQTKHIWTD